MPLDELADRLQVTIPTAPRLLHRSWFSPAALWRAARSRQSFELPGWRIEVVDLDGRRIDKVLAAKTAGKLSG